MTVIDKAVEWAVTTANDNAHGYDQSSRWGPDYDCSTFVITAFETAGVKVKSKGATYTGNMYNAFIACGFADITKQVNLKTGEGLKKGDVVLKPNAHTEMMINSSQLVGANINEKGTATGGQTGDQTGKEVYIKDYYNYPWTYVLRYPYGSSDDTPSISKDNVIKGNCYLVLEEMKVNATYIYAYLSAKGWTLNAISGMLGNMQTESTINPEIWESLTPNTSKGFGLVQWTPATKLIEWAESKNMDYTDIDTQLERIMYEVVNGGQYYATSDYPESFSDFTKSNKSPEYLARAFLHNYERPANTNQPNRATQARYWFNYLSDINPDLQPTNPSQSKSRKMSLLMMYIATKRR